MLLHIQVIPGIRKIDLQNFAYMISMFYYPLSAYCAQASPHTLKPASLHTPSTARGFSDSDWICTPHAGPTQLHKLAPHTHTHKLHCTNQFEQCVYTVELSVYRTLKRQSRHWCDHHETEDNVRILALHFQRWRWKSPLHPLWFIMVHLQESHWRKSAIPFTRHHENYLRLEKNTRAKYGRFFVIYQALHS